jgi:tetratricopeptide (TPR) repeat protein
MRYLQFAAALFVVLTGVSTAVAAEEPLSPVAYLKILADSKLTYNVINQPSKTPVEVRTCPDPAGPLRVVVRDGEKKLVPWVPSAEAAKLLSQGEKNWQAGEHIEAAARYMLATEKDPESLTAHLFLGDAYLIGGKDPEMALEQYQKAIALDPTFPSGHFFSATAYVQLGRKAEAREEIIRALTYHPSYEPVWKIARGAPQTWGIRPVRTHRFEPPKGYLGANGPKGIDVFGGAKGEWLGYALCKAVWANEAQFQKKRTEGGWSIDEESACLQNQFESVYNATKAKLEKQKSAPVAESAVIAALPPLEAHIGKVANEQLLVGYILFEIVGRNCPLALRVMDDAMKQQVEGYVRKYVIVAAE